MHATERTKAAASRPKGTSVQLQPALALVIAPPRSPNPAQSFQVEVSALENVERESTTTIKLNLNFSFRQASCTCAMYRNGRKYKNQLVICNLYLYIDTVVTLLPMERYSGRSYRGHYCVNEVTKWPLQYCTGLYVSA